MVGTLKLAIEAAPRLEIACAVGRRESVRNVRVELIMTGITNKKPQFSPKLSYTMEVRNKLRVCKG